MALVKTEAQQCRANSASAVHFILARLTEFIKHTCGWIAE